VSDLRRGNVVAAGAAPARDIVGKAYQVTTERTFSRPRKAGHVGKPQAAILAGKSGAKEHLSPFIKARDEAFVAGNRRRR